VSTTLDRWFNLPVNTTAVKNENRIVKDPKLRGKIRYKCGCGVVSDFLDLVETRGRCPNCNSQLCKFNGDGKDE